MKEHSEFAITSKKLLLTWEKKIHIFKPLLGVVFYEKVGCHKCPHSWGNAKSATQVLNVL